MQASGRVEKYDIRQIESLTKNRAYHTLSHWKTLFHWQSIDCYDLLVLVQKARICCMSSRLCICHMTIFHWQSSGWYHFLSLVKARICCRGLHMTLFHWRSSGWYYYCLFVWVKARTGGRELHICHWILCSL